MKRSSLSKSRFIAGIILVTTAVSKVGTLTGVSKAESPAISCALQDHVARLSWTIRQIVGLAGSLPEEKLASRGQHLFSAKPLDMVSNGLLPWPGSESEFLTGSCRTYLRVATQHIDGISSEHRPPP